MCKIATRIYQLDALRGLAAFSVVIGHCLGVFPFIAADGYEKDIIPIISILTYSPLHLFWAAHEAVVLFFVLSGFIVSSLFQWNTTKIFSIYYKENFTYIYSLFSFSNNFSFIINAVIRTRNSWSE